ncbi:hypothetical protein MRB53_041553 [Persea americana]|nr:hypothetical protein MRB53_041553 [Persea americana]
MVTESEQDSPTGSSQGDSEQDEVEEQQAPENFDYLNLPAELQSQVYAHLTDLLTIRNLSLASKTTYELYKANEQKINDQLIRFYVDEIGVYYDFLATLHIDPAAVLHPPANGWEHLVNAKAKDWKKTELAMQVIRHLPYIRTATPHDHQDNYHNIDYKSVVIDRSTWRAGDRHPNEDVDELVETFTERIKYEHIVAIAYGYESGGVITVLDTLSGVIHEEIVRMDPGDEMPIHEYLQQRRQKLRNCEQVFVPGEEPLDEPSEVYEYDEQEAAEVEEKGEPTLPKELFGHEEDFRWVRYLYKKHGWPSMDWKKAECSKAVRQYAEKRNDEYWM